MFVLIDTCSWIDLVKKDEENPWISKLKFWIDNGNIKILIPEYVILEWNKNKLKKKKDIQILWRDREKDFNRVAKMIKNNFIPEMKLSIEFIDNQFEMLDNIIYNNSFKVLTSEKVKSLIPEKHIRKFAPFHNNLDSTKDAFIYFSTLEFCHKNGINELIFISENTREFGRPLDIDKTKGSINDIHPELLIDFPDVNVKYYGKIGLALSELSSELPTNNLLSNQQSIYGQQDDFNYLKIDKNLPILEQLYDFSNKIHKELAFLPLHILKNLYPFKSIQNSRVAYSNFTLITDNIEIVSFFDKIEINNGAVNLKANTIESTFENLDKITKIIKSLNQNLIFKLKSANSNQEVKIRILSDEVGCTCVNCTYGKLKFNDFFNLLNSYSGSIKDLMKEAYVNYKIGNYVKACENYNKLYEMALAEGYHTLAYISKYNLFNIKPFIFLEYWEENKRDELLENLEKIDLLHEYKLATTNDNKPIIEWIKENKFFINSRDKITLKILNIIDNYYFQLNGGISSNSYVRDLINYFIELDAFVNFNYIIYDKFSDYKSLVNLIIEGLFASHAMNEAKVCKLISFDDWLIKKIIDYGNADDINKYFIRYKLQEIKYIKSSKNGYSYIELVNNFFTNVSFFHKTEINKFKNNDFIHSYNSIFSNILTLVSISNFNLIQLNSISKKTIKYLETENWIYSYNYKYINIFLKRIGIKLNKDILERFFNLALKKYIQNNPEILDIISRTLHERKFKFLISKSQWDNIRSICFSEQKLLNSDFEDVITNIYLSIGNIEYKEEIKNLIRSSLKTNFNFNLFYLSTVYDIIEFDESLFNYAIDFSIPESDYQSFASFISRRKDEIFYNINKVINICFKYNIDSNHKKFNWIRRINDYYKWLLDLDNFDYRKFHPYWLKEYPTMYFYKKFYLSAKLKQTLITTLKNRFDLDLESQYLNIYVRKTWNKK